MRRMKDLTPIAEGDVVLKERKLGRAQGDPAPKVGLSSEKRMAEKRERYERCLPVAATSWKTRAHRLRCASATSTARCGACLSCRAS